MVRRVLILFLLLGAAGFSAYDELLAMERAGLERAQILEICTRNGGRFIQQRLDAGELFGQVAPGFRADLLLLSRNPLQDLNSIEDYRIGVMAWGHWRSTEFFAPLLEAIRQQYQAAN